MSGDRHLAPLVAAFASLRGAVLRRWFPLRLRTGRRYDQIIDEMRRLRPRRILEVGACAGDTAAYMIRAALALSPRADVDYFGFDLFDEASEKVLDRESAKRPGSLDAVRRRLEAIRVRGVRARVTLVRGDTVRTLARLAGEISPVDLVFIDGGHSYETVRADWTNCARLAHPGTVIFFDDYPLWGVGPAVDEIDRAVWNVEVLQPGDRFGEHVHHLVRVTYR